MICYLFQPSRGGRKSRLWSARIRLDEWPRLRTIPLHITDKRVAKEELQRRLTELERNAYGVGVPKITREAVRAPIASHLQAFLAAGDKLAPNTLAKYRNSIPKLCERCNWLSVRDVTAQSFTDWRDDSGLRPKTLNDLLGSMGAFLNWMIRKRLIPENPLRSVAKVPNHEAGGFRRSLSVEEIGRLLAVAPTHRATVYQTMLYTGLRRARFAGAQMG